MKKKILSILFALVLGVSLMLIPPVVSADSTPVIDGTLTSGEWDAYYLGTSVTGWSGGMSVDVYGFADDTYLYAAYEADMTQPGWSAAAGLCTSNNLYYRTPQSASWPNPGYTLLAAGGYPADVSQTDGSGWTSLPGSFADNGIDIYSGDGCYNTIPNPNVAEVKIPLSLLTYAGADNQIALGGQYWQYDGATPFFVAMPPVAMSEFEIQKASIDFGNPSDDKVSVKGKLELDLVNGDNVDIDADDVIVTVGPFSDTISAGQMVEKKPGEWEYKGVGTIKNMKIDWNKGVFAFSLEKANLSALTDPDEVTISIQVGDDLGEKTITMTEKRRWDYKAP